MSSPAKVVFGFFFLLGATALYFGTRGLPFGGVNTAPRHAQVWQFLTDPAAHANWKVQPGTVCGSAPFIQPTAGFIGYLWGDSFRLGHTHQGLDIFSGTQVGITPVYAAYSGYLSRQWGWKSSLIIRIPSDPLMPTRQIWTYYTHMADPSGTVSYIVPQFPEGTSEMFVEAGTLLGYQGNYSGDPGNPVGVHLHFSIVKDQNGQYLNELDINNTYDPSPYFGLPLNAALNKDTIPLCALPRVKVKLP